MNNTIEYPLSNVSLLNNSLLNNSLNNTPIILMRASTNFFFILFLISIFCMLNIVIYGIIDCNHNHKKKSVVFIQFKKNYLNKYNYFI